MGIRVVKHKRKEKLMTNRDLSTSTQYYDAIANNYSFEIEKRKKYIQSINKWIGSLMRSHSCTNVLDVGTGDGTRLLNILEDVRYSSLNIVEPSEKLIKIAQSHFPMANCYNKDLQGCELPDSSFSHVLSLWNVLGHVTNRREFVSKIFQLLEPGGYFIFDINNRYNIKQYGLFSVVKNCLRDLFSKAESGYFILQNGENLTRVFIHSKRDATALMKVAGFKVTKVYYVDYESGCFRRSQFFGQMLIVGRKGN